MERLQTGFGTGLRLGMVAIVGILNLLFSPSYSGFKISWQIMFIALFDNNIPQNGTMLVATGMKFKK